EGYRAELAARVPPAPSAPRAPGPLRARDIVWGTTVAYLTMPVYAAAAVAVEAGVVDLSVLGLIPFVLVSSLVPAALLGAPTGAALAWCLRRVAHQAWHVVAFAVLGAAVAALVVLVLLSGLELAFLVPATALAAATG